MDLVYRSSEMDHGDMFSAGDVLVGKIAWAADCLYGYMGVE